MKTLALRMEEHNRNALAVAHWLEGHEKVAGVPHPGLESHPQHELAGRQMSGYGGTFSFCLRGGQDAVFRLLERVKVLTLAESLGGVESPIEHPVTMTHASVAPEVLREMGITPDLMRISVGIEDVEDLIGDLEQALKKCEEGTGRLPFLILQGTGLFGVRIWTKRRLAIRKPLCLDRPISYG